MKKCLPVCLLLAAVSGLVLASNLASADIVMTGRSSQTNYNYVYGFAASNVGGNTILDGVLEAGDTVADSYSGSNQGNDGPSGFWTAGADIMVGHSFFISPFPSAVTTISAIGSTTSSCSTTGIGSGALMNSSSPGNNLILNFTVTDIRQFSINGSVQSTKPNPSGGNRVILQRWDGIVWQNGGFDSFSLPGGLGSFDVSGTLTAGDYRLIGSSSINVFDNDSGSSSFSYSFSSIPEPASALTLCPLLGMWMFRRRRNG